MGANPAGTRSKWATWKKIIRENKAYVWFMLETKCNRVNELKMENFVIFEKSER